MAALVAAGAITSVAYGHGGPSSVNTVARGAPLQAEMSLKAPPARALSAAVGTDRRYALANGCYSLRSRSTGRALSLGAGTEVLRFQATALGSYLLYTRDRNFVASSSTGRVVRAFDPSSSANWTVTTAGSGFKLTTADGRRLGGGDTYSAEVASGCAVFPEIQNSWTGTPATSKTPWGEVRGLLDGHMHMMAFEFLGGKAHCGRPWDPFGASAALVDCVDHRATAGCGAVLENVLSGTPTRCHGAGGWPDFTGWPAPDSLTHEQTYYKWLERAYAGGLRVFVNLFVENKVLCELYPLKQNNCNEMNSVRLQNKRINQLQDYIDAQNGGPGRGFFRLVKSPAEARKVISQGKLAVIKGVEISEPFDCRVYNDRPYCDRAQIDRQLKELYGYGVRQMELVNKFDNALAGVAGDSGSTGVVVNSGNKYETGEYWQMEACQGARDEEDKRQIGVYKHDYNDIGSNLIENYVPMGTAPIYPQGANCNARGLTELGEHAVRALAKRNMIIDPDHLSVRARKSLMAITEAERYSGVMSSHSWSTPDVEPRIYKSGGVITPMQGQAPSWVEHWRELRAKRDRRFLYGLGYGADQNGFASQIQPREGSSVKYPFKSFDGKVTFNRQTSGTRVFDFNKDGVANYGLFPDWWQDLRNVGGPAIEQELMNGAESYLQMWERAEGIPFGCKSGREHFTRSGLGKLRLRYDSDRLLRRGGQPKVRGNRAWSWCVMRKRNARRKVVTALDRKGRVQLIGSNAPGYSAKQIRPGSKAKRLRGRAKRIGKGLYVRRAGKRSRYVFTVRKGRVRTVALATSSASRNAKRLRAYLRLARLR